MTVPDIDGGEKALSLTVYDYESLHDEPRELWGWRIERDDTIIDSESNFNSEREAQSHGERVLLNYANPALSVGNDGGADYEAKAQQLLIDLAFAKASTQEAACTNFGMGVRFVQLEVAKRALAQAAADGKEAALRETYERIGDAALASAFDDGMKAEGEKVLAKNAELVAALEKARPYVEKHVIWSLGELKEPAILLVAEIDAAIAAAGHKT